jgi:hypothetical protein
VIFSGSNLLISHFLARSYRECHNNVPKTSPFSTRYKNLNTNKRSQTQINSSTFAAFVCVLEIYGSLGIRGVGLNVGAYPCGRPRGWAQGHTPTNGVTPPNPRDPNLFNNYR